MKKSRLFFAFLILLILSVIIGLGLFFAGYLETNKKISYRNDLIAKNVIHTLRTLETRINRAYDTQQQKTNDGTYMIASALQNFADGDNYSGPRVFEKGVVLQIRNDQIVYPEDFDYRFERLDVEMLKSKPSLEITPLVNIDGDAIQVGGMTALPITENYWYVDWTDEDKINGIYNDQIEFFDMLEDLQAAFNGYLFLFDRRSSDLDPYFLPADFEDVEDFKRIGFTKELIESKTFLFAIGDQSYDVEYATLRFFNTPVDAVILLNNTGQLMDIANNVLLIMLLIQLAMAAVIMWIYWVRCYVRDHALTPDQKDDYRPEHIRKIIRSIGLIGAFVVFILTASVNSLSTLSREAQTNNRKLDLISNKMSANDSMTSRFRTDIETWTIVYARKIAELLAFYPEFQDADFLYQANDLIGSEYILLFDENGQEIVGSNSYIDLNLTDDFSGSGGEIASLLKGAPFVIRHPEPDPILHKDTQLIGVSTFLSKAEKYAALIIAIDPEMTWRADEKDELYSYLNMITPAGNSAFVVENETGRILFSSEDSTVGKKAEGIGLYGSSAPDTEFDSFRLKIEQNPVDFYGAYQYDEPYQFYYLTLSDVLQSTTLPFSIGFSLSFLLIYWIITSIMLHSYRSQTYAETVRVTQSAVHDSIFDETYNSEWARQQLDSDEPNSPLYVWKNFVPEQKIGVFTRVLFGVALIIGIYEFFGSDSDAARSLIDFVLRGTWKRGINLMALAATMILIFAFTIFVLFKNLLLALLKNVLDRKAETILRLVLSLLQYAAIIAFLYFVFGFLGFDTRTLIASVGFMSLAVTLGARDLVADILAGIFIVFEDDFRVGDIVEVNGFSGIVQEIGVRSTKVIGIGDNVKIFGNQSVKNVLNMTKMNSWYSLDLKVPANQPIREIEDMLREKLPAVGEAIPEILSGPYYKGIMQIGDTYTLYIIAECRQDYYRKVQRELNHAIIDLFAEHGYKFV